MKPARPIGPGRSVAACVAIAAAFATGCAAPRIAPIDLGEPGWKVHESAAVWHPPGNAPELAGELLVAAHPDGRLLVQFSKQSLPIVTATAVPGAWSIASPLRRSAVGGHGRPTDRVPWFQIRSLPPGAPGSARWKLTAVPGAPWRLGAASGTEFVEGPNP